MKRGVFAMFVLLATSAHAGSVFRDAKSLETLKKRFEEEKAADPKSCEAVYYGLFIDDKGQPRESLRGDGPVLHQDLWTADAAPAAESESTLEKVKALYRSTMLAREDFKRDGRVVEEWDRRIGRAKLVIFDKAPGDETGTGAFMDTFNSWELTPKPPAPEQSFAELATPKEEKPRPRDLLDEPIYPTSFRRGPPVVAWGKKRAAGLRSPAAQAFVMGHELTHTLNWAPPALVSCLSDEKSVGARKELPRRGDSLDSQFGTPSLSSDRIREIIQTVPLPKLDLEKYKKKTEPGHIDYRSGAGTGHVADVEKLVVEGKIAEAKAALAKLRDAGALPEQMTEAVADYAGTVVATKFIRDNYATPAARRAAALAVLFSLPPQLFPKEAEEVMNAVGSKPMNERRALRLLLANPDFRSFVGCDFRAKPAPRWCA